jgi:hypothetical protein
LVERTISFGIDDTYTDLKAVLIEKGCQIKSEEPPRQILVKQGSLWGISPKTAKKLLQFNLTVANSGTKITCSSRLNADWKNLTIIGCVLAVALVGICLWIGFDLGTFMVTQIPGFWSWLVTINSNVDFQAGQALVNLTRALAVFLLVVILSEIVIAVHVYAGIDRFAEENLDLLSSLEPAEKTASQQQSLS